MALHLPPVAEDTTEPSPTRIRRRGSTAPGPETPRDEPLGAVRRPRPGTTGRPAEHAGHRQQPARPTPQAPSPGRASVRQSSSLARVSAPQPYAFYEALFRRLLARCQQRAPRHGFRFKNKLYAVDASTIDLCLAAFRWASFRRTKGAIKLHAGMDQEGHLPTFISVTMARPATSRWPARGRSRPAAWWVPSPRIRLPATLSYRMPANRAALGAFL